MNIDITNASEGKCYKANRSKTTLSTTNQDLAGKSPPKSAPPPQTDDACLDKHNFYRAQKSLPPLEWDDKLASNAQSWANQMRGRMQHASGTGEGENLYFGGGGCTSGVDMWMAEGGSSMPNYVVTQSNYRNIGHYSQVMWRETRKLGCGSYSNLVVCRYYPAGNMLGNKMY